MTKVVFTEVKKPPFQFPKRKLEIAIVGSAVAATLVTAILAGVGRVRPETAAIVANVIASVYIILIIAFDMFVADSKLGESDSERLKSIVSQKLQGVQVKVVVLVSVLISLVSSVLVNMSDTYRTPASVASVLAMVATMRYVFSAANLTRSDAERLFPDAGKPLLSTIAVAHATRSNTNSTKF